MSEKLDVLRLGYRKGRDPRITTHLALVARAMGADGFFLAGDEDKVMFENLKSVDSRFGGNLRSLRQAEGRQTTWPKVVTES